MADNDEGELEGATKQAETEDTPSTSPTSSAPPAAAPPRPAPPKASESRASSRHATLLGVAPGPLEPRSPPHEAAPAPLPAADTQPMVVRAPGPVHSEASAALSEPSIEVEIHVEGLEGLEDLQGSASGQPITSESEAGEASGVYQVPPAHHSGRRKRNSAGAHQSLVGATLREDTGAHLSVPHSARSTRGQRPRSDSPPRPPRSDSPPRPPRGRRTGSFASVGTPARRGVTRSLQSLVRATLETGIHAAAPASEGSENPDGAPSAETQAPAGQQEPRESETGFHKPLPPQRKIVHLWEELGLRLGQRMAEAVGDDHLYLLIMAVVVGVASGAAAGLLLLWIARAVELFPAVGRAFPSFGWIYLILAPALGGLLVGGLRLFARRYLGDIPEGIPAVIEAVGQQGRLRGRAGSLLGLGTGFTIASGGSVGHEGPTVAIGATVGSVLGRFFGLRMRRQTTMIGAGCAAGLAAAFNAPLAGVIFTVEVVFKRSVGASVGSMSVFTPLIVAAVAGTFTSHAIFGQRTELILPGDVEGDRILVEMVFFLAVAVVAGLLSPVMSRAVLLTGDLFDRLKRIPEWAKPAIGGLAVGLLGTLLFTDLLGPGRGIVFEALHSELAWQIALAFALLKILATALTIGSGGMGGVFMPSLVIGACVGTVVHSIAELALGPGVSQPAAYALVGMGAYLGATLRAPLTPIVMIFELTGDYGLILPLMFACILSAFVAGRVEADTLFDLSLRRRGSAKLLEHDDTTVMQRGRVGDLMVRPDHMLRLESGFDEVQRAALIEESPTLYVLDDDERVAAVLDSRTLAARALRGELDRDASAGDLASSERPTLLVPEDTLAGAMMAFARSGRDVLPVVDADRQLLGLLERTDLMAHYSEHVLEQQNAELLVHGGAGLDHEVNLGLGVTLERVVVGRAWAGRSLAQLKLRQVVQVQVLEWQRGEGLLDLDPHAPLREGDILALAGSREALLAARWVE